MEDSKSVDQDRVARLLEELQSAFPIASFELAENTIWVTRAEGDDPVECEVSGSLEDLRAGITDFLSATYLPHQAILYRNRAEFLVSIAQSYYVDSLTHYDTRIGVDDFAPDFHYAVSPISKTLERWLSISVDGDWLDSSLYSIKINFPASELDKSENDNAARWNKAYAAVHTVILNLSRSFHIDLELISLPEDYDSDPYYEVLEEAGKTLGTGKQLINKTYDYDLMQYYYRAVVMKDSPFKFLAFYQVLEALFDEAQRIESVADVRGLLTASGFSPWADMKVQELVESVLRYSTERDERSKLRRVLELFFRGSQHDDAYQRANSDIADLLIRGGWLGKLEDLKDVARLASVLYDYRCRAAHAERTFPRSQSVDPEVEKEALLLRVVKLFAERVIIGYSFHPPT